MTGAAAAVAYPLRLRGEGCAGCAGLASVACAVAGSAAADFRCLQALPELTDLTDEDVEAWLEKSCRKLTAPQRRAIAADAADAAGKPPVYVYNRLDLNGFWAN